MLSKVQKVILSLGIGLCLVASLLFVCNVQRYTSSLIVKKQALENISDKFVIHLPTIEENTSSYGYTTFLDERLSETEKSAQNFAFSPMVLPDNFADENNKLIINSEIDTETTVIGTNENFNIVSGLTLQQGNFFNKEQIAKGEKICVVSSAVLNYFGLNTNDASIIFNGEEFKIIGVFTLAPIAGNAWSLFNFAPDNERLILMPYTAINEKSGSNGQINYVLAKPNQSMSSAQLSNFTDNVTNNLKNLAKEGETPMTAVPLYKIFQLSQNDNVSIIIAGIAALSAVLLILAGFNIMQMTKASVYGNQRTIAIKMAVGASPFVICIELLKELAVVCIKASYFGLAATAMLVLILNNAQGFRVLSFDFLSIAIGLISIACMLFISVLIPFRIIVKLPITDVLGTQREGG